MNASRQSPLMSTDRLADYLDEPSVRIVDASWYLPTMNRDGSAEYNNAHIPGALYWDIDKIADQDGHLPHMMPASNQFETQMGELGISNETTVVVYDALGLFSAARPWWMLRAFGHQNAFILDGGLPKWMAEGRPLNADKPDFSTCSYTATLDTRFIKSVEEVLENVNSKSAQLVDARSRGRFCGKDAEPRPGCRSGHIPGAVNLPFDHLIDPKNKTLLPEDALRKRYENVGIDLDKPTITSCGSGVTACILALGMYVLNKPNVSVYDGSWSEWGTQDDLPLETV